MHVLVAVFSRLLAAAGGDGRVKRVACMAGLIVCMQRIASWRNVGVAFAVGLQSCRRGCVFVLSRAPCRHCKEKKDSGVRAPV